MTTLVAEHRGTVTGVVVCPASEKLVSTCLTTASAVDESRRMKKDGRFQVKKDRARTWVVVDTRKGTIAKTRITDRDRAQRIADRLNALGGGQDG